MVVLSIMKIKNELHTKGEMELNLKNEREKKRKKSSTEHTTSLFTLTVTHLQ